MAERLDLREDKVMRLADFLATTAARDEPETMRLGDWLSLERIETPELNTFFETSDEQRKEWEKQGPIGYFEQAIRQDKTEMIPFNPESPIKGIKLWNTINRIKRNRYENNPEQKNFDIDLINKFLMKSEEERIRGFTIGGRITQGAAALPGYMIEFLATGGLAAIGKKAVSKTVQPIVKQIVKRKALKFATRVAGGLAGATVRTAAMPHRVVGSFAERQINSSLELTEAGLQIAKESREKPFISFMKATGDVVIENFSEVTGPELAKIAAKVVPRKMALGMAKLFKKLHPGKNINKLFTKAGYNGFLEELGEERVGALLRAVTGVEDFGADNPDSMFDRVVASIPDGEEMLVEAGVLAIPGAIHAGAQQTAKIIQSRKVTKRPGETIIDEKTGEPRVIKGFRQDISDKTIEEILETTEAPIRPAIAPEIALVKPPVKPVEAIRPEAIPRVEKPEIVPKKAIIKEPAEFVRVRETTLLKRRIQTLARGAKMGAIATREQVKQTQTELIGIIEKSGIEAKDKAKFIRAIKNTQTAVQLSKILPEVEQRLTTLKETSESKSLRSKIGKTLKITRPKKVAGKPIGKFTPEVQDVLDKARVSAKLTGEQAQEKIVASLEAIGDDIPTPAQALENRILSLFGGLKDKSSGELRESLKVLQDLIDKGRSESLERLERRKVKLAEDVSMSLQSIIGRKTPSKRRIKGSFERLRKTVSRSFSTFLGWDNILNLLAIDDKVAPRESALEKIARVNANETGEKGTIRLNIEKITKSALKAFNLKTNAQLIRQWRRDSEIKEIGTFKNERGEEALLELSKAEARKIWMEFQDPTLVETLTSDRGNAYSPDMIQAIEDLLTQQDRDFALAQLQFYRDFYTDVVNPVYSDIYGINLPFNEFYSPISREHKEERVVDTFLKEMGFRRSVTTGSLKSRVRNLNPIKIRSDISVLQQHIMEMSHFVNWADKIRQLNAIFTDSETKDVINSKFGGEMQKVISDFMKDFTRGGMDRSKNFGAWDKIRVNFTRAKLSIKTALLLKQMVSFVAFADDVPLVSFISGVSDFVAHPIRSTNILNQSEVMRARGANLTRDIKDAALSDEFSAFRTRPSFRNMLMILTKIGDRGAILLGGWSVYKHTLEKTGSKEKAMQIFEERTSATQQSADLSQLSIWQRGNTFQKMFTMFTSSQNQYFRKEYMAIRNLIAGKQSVSKTAKTILIYHFLLPMFFQWVVDFGKWNRDEQLRASILGSFNGIFIIKDILDSIIREAIGLRRFDLTIAPFSIVNGIFTAMNTIDIDDITWEDVLSALIELDGTVGGLAGLPAEQVRNKVEAIGDIYEGEVKRGILRLLGWTEWVIDNNEE